MAFMYVYPPGPPYQTTYLSKSFPEHHWPLEHTRHKIGHALHDLVYPLETPISNPCADVRESMTNYYVDVELPGLADKKNVSLTWTNSSTLLVRATVRRPAVKEEEADAAQASAGAAADTDNKQDGNEAKRQSEHAVHQLVRERRMGLFERAFDFAVPVDHSAVDAHLQFGLLRIVVPKVEKEQKHLKQVEITQTDT